MMNRHTPRSRRKNRRLHVASCGRKPRINLYDVAASLLDAKGDAVTIIDRRGVILAVNRAAEGRFASNAQKLVGTLLWDHYSLERIPYQRILFHQVVKSGDPIAVRNRESGRWFQTIIYPIRHGTCRIEAVALCATDITPLVDAQEQYKRVSVALMSAQEDERNRISRDLHDDVGQKMTALALGLRAIETSIMGGRGVEIDDVRSAIRNLEMVMKRTRQISYQLRPPSLGSVSLPRVLAAFCASFADSSDISIDFNSEESLPDIPELTATAVYRFVQEGLTNVVRHARSARAWVSLDCVDGELSVSLEDDGIGFDPKDTAEGIGLSGLRDRFQMLNGTMDVESFPGKGTRLSGSLPIEPELSGG